MQDLQHAGEGDYVLAPLGARALAHIIDEMIILILSVLVLFAILSLLWSLNLTNLQPDPSTLFMGVFTTRMFIEVGLFFFYSGYFYSRSGATPGKRIMGLQVIKESGEKLSCFEGGIRDGIGKRISGLIFSIGFVIAYFRQDRKALHDFMYKTRVVLKR